MAYPALATDRSPGILPTNNRSRGGEGDLWAQAASTLSKEERRFLDINRTTPDQILRVIQQRIQESEQKQWYFRKRDGELITVRRLLEKIAGAINKFKSIGDVVAQYDPGHAALPWAALRFVLELAVCDVHKRGSMLEGLETISEAIANFAEYEKYLNGISDCRTRLAKGIARAYAAILKYLVRARRYWGSSTVKRFTKGLMGSSNDLQTLAVLNRQEKDAFKLVSLIHAEEQAEDRSNLVNTLKVIENDLNCKSQRSENERRTMMQRLAPVFTNDNYDNNLSIRVSNTASWIFELQSFKQWITLDSFRAKLYWLHGPPGFGKSVLIANVINRLQKEQAKFLAYFFCVSEDNTKSEPEAILTSWIAQMIWQNDDAAHVVRKILYDEERLVTTWTKKWACFRALCQRFPLSIFIVDGFDECTNVNKISRYHTHDGRSKFLRQLIQEASLTKVRIMIVSRDVAELRSEISIARAAKAKIIIFDYEIREEDTRQDVQTFSENVMNLKLCNKEQDLRSNLADKAASKAQGMLLWIHLLSRHIDPSLNAVQLQDVISKMPTGIHQAYERILSRISHLEDNEKQRVLLLMRWVLFAVRPLTIKELAEALIIPEELQHNDYPADMLPDTWKNDYINEEYVSGVIREPLGSLIYIRESRERVCNLSDKTVHFVHFSVKEHLLRILGTQNFGFYNQRSENQRLAKLCLKYLCYEVFSCYEPGSKSLMKGLIASHPFLPYAAKFWYLHASGGHQIPEDLVVYVKRLLDPKTRNWVVWSELFEVPWWVPFKAFRQSLSWSGQVHNTSTEMKEDWIQQDEPLKRSIRIGNPLYYASYLGVTVILKDLIREGVDINAIGGAFGSAVQAAAAFGYSDTVESLLQEGADASQNCGFFSSPLIAAASYGYAKTVEVLLRHRARVDLATPTGYTALHCASSGGSIDVVQQLLEAGSEINASVSGEGTPLYMAVINGHIEVSRLLINGGATLKNAGLDCKHLSHETEGCKCVTPLLVAAQIGNGRLAEILMELCIKINTRSRDLSRLTAGISSDAIGTGERRQASPMETARHSPCGRTGTLELPLDALLAIDMAMDDIGHETSLLLLRYGLFRPILGNLSLANTPSSDKAPLCYSARLQMAAFRGSYSQVEALLTEDGSTQDSSMLGSALLVVALTDSPEIAELLLRNGAPILYKSCKGHTALHNAVVRGNKDMALFLIKHGAQTWSHDFAGRSPMDLAVGSAHVGRCVPEIVRALAMEGGFGTLPDPSNVLINNWHRICCQLEGISIPSLSQKQLEQEAASAEIYKWAESGDRFSRPPLFFAQGSGSDGKFNLYGQIFGEDRFVAALVAQDSGRACLVNARVDLQHQTLEGKWSNSGSLLHGTISFKKRLSEGASERDS